MRTALERWWLLPAIVAGWVCAVLMGPPEVALADSLLQNGSFAEWDASGPKSWRVEIGARNGQGPASRVERADGPGLRLSGDAQTKLWNSVSQDFHAEPGNCYRLTFNARAMGLRRDPGQYDNAYVGLKLTDSAGERVSGCRRPCIRSWAIPGSANP